MYNCFKIQTLDEIFQHICCIFLVFVPQTQIEFTFAVAQSGTQGLYLVQFGVEIPFELLILTFAHLLFLHFLNSFHQFVEFITFMGEVEFHGPLIFVEEKGYLRPVVAQEDPRGQLLCCQISSIAFDDIQQFCLAANFFDFYLAQLYFIFAEGAQKEIVFPLNDNHFEYIVEISHCISSGVGAKFMLNYPQTFVIFYEKGTIVGVDGQRNEHV